MVAACGRGGDAVGTGVAAAVVEDDVDTGTATAVVSVASGMAVVGRSGVPCAPRRTGGRSRDVVHIAASATNPAATAPANAIANRRRVVEPAASARSCSVPSVGTGS